MIAWCDSLTFLVVEGQFEPILQLVKEEFPSFVLEETQPKFHPAECRRDSVSSHSAPTDEDDDQSVNFGDLSGIDIGSRVGNSEASLLGFKEPSLLKTVSRYPLMPCSFLAPPDVVWGSSTSGIGF